MLIKLKPLVAICLIVIFFLSCGQKIEPKNVHPDIISLDSMVFIDQNKRPFSSDSLDNKISLVNFFFTSCKTICPITNHHLGKLSKQLSKSSKIQFISISVDPIKDSLPVLRQYANRYNTEDIDWKFITGPSESIKHLIQNNFKVLLKTHPDRGDIIHSDKIFLISTEGRIIRYFSGTNPRCVRQITHALDSLELNSPIIIHKKGT